MMQFQSVRGRSYETYGSYAGCFARLMFFSDGRVLYIRVRAPVYESTEQNREKSALTLLTILSILFNKSRA